MAINNTGYSSNQFLNISQVESNPVARTIADNPDFLYPGHSIPINRATRKTSCTTWVYSWNFS